MVKFWINFSVPAIIYLNRQHFELLTDIHFYYSLRWIKFYRLFTLFCSNRLFCLSLSCSNYLFHLSCSDSFSRFCNRLYRYFFFVLPNHVQLSEELLSRTSFNVLRMPYNLKSKIFISPRSNKFNHLGMLSIGIGHNEIEIKCSLCPIIVFTYKYWFSLEQW